MKVQNIVALSLTVLMTAGCAKSTNQNPRAENNSRLVQISHPPIGEVRLARIGEPLVLQGVYRESEVIVDRLHVPYDQETKHGYIIQAGRYKWVERYKKASYFYPEEGESGGGVISIDEKPWERIMVIGNTLCVVISGRLRSCKREAEFRIEKIQKPVQELRIESLVSGLTFKHTAETLPSEY